MTNIANLDYIDYEMNELHNRFSKTNGSLDDLNQLLIKMSLDKDYHNMIASQNNEGLFYDDPNYQNISNQTSAYSFLRRLLDGGKFYSIQEFTSFIEYLCGHPSFKYLNGLEELVQSCMYVISIEGVNSSGISDYSASYINDLKEHIPEYLEVSDYKRYCTFFTRDLALTDGDTINELYIFLREIEDKNVHILEDDMEEHFGVDYDLEEDIAGGNLQLFLKTIRKYGKVVNRKLKK